MLGGLPQLRAIFIKLQDFVAYHGAILFVVWRSRLGELERMLDGGPAAGVLVYFPGVGIDNVFGSSAKPWTRGIHE
ncbi:hypothetical protein [Aliiruegeria lutimaris]|uniref:hypothetical protein n=1 Tax=Aliiruegeria lutimaris TaxID=571298 RepID=UPI000B891962|nr:hypothetical protein [Aliiruegeria lutimaris]